jgi:hypothetical protein
MKVKKGAFLIFGLSTWANIYRTHACAVEKILIGLHSAGYRMLHLNNVAEPGPHIYY